MARIFKYTLNVESEQTIEMPQHARVVALQTQYEEPCVWAQVDGDGAGKTTPRTFLTFGTGHPISELMHLSYVGTYQLRGGALVFHVYERLS